MGQWLGQGEDEAGRGGCSLLAVQEQQVEQMREGEKEVEENSNLLKVTCSVFTSSEVTVYKLPSTFSC